MALTQEAIRAIIFHALTNLNMERDTTNQVSVGMDTPLFGGTALLDSLDLVSVIADVELAVSDAMGAAISLIDDQAMSEEISPFTDVRTLCAYILHLTAGKA